MCSLAQSGKICLGRLDLVSGEALEDIGAISRSEGCDPISCRGELVGVFGVTGRSEGYGTDRKTELDDADEFRRDFMRA